jgi:hypothetical protein
MATEGSDYVLIERGCIWQWSHRRQAAGVTNEGVVVAPPPPHLQGSGELGKSMLINKRSGRIVAIFDARESSEELQRRSIDSTDVEIIDAGGQLLLPGLHDAHIHIANTGESLFYLDLKHCRSMADLTDAVKQHAEKHPTLPWIIGVSWDQTDLGRSGLHKILILSFV